ncbi:hypothetical protein H8959_014074 [Pygathrix nigripes]
MTGLVSSRRLRGTPGHLLVGSMSLPDSTISQSRPCTPDKVRCISRSVRPSMISLQSASNPPPSVPGARAPVTWGCCELLGHPAVTHTQCLNCCPVLHSSDHLLAASLALLQMFPSPPGWCFL